jgi:outer membrane protein assembly factor BamD (BamD/ComL family)
MKRYLYLIAAVLAIALPLFAQEGPPDNNHGIMVRVAPIYLNPDTSATKLDEVPRGREVIILEQSRNWLHVLGSVAQQKDINGWIIDKGVIRPNTPDGDKILFGEGASSELIASQRGGRKNAADDARRLYFRTYEYFPNSPLAGEALYRAADILWQIEAGDVRSRPSAKQKSPSMRPEIDEQYMKLVIKKFPGTKWADLAAYHLLENKTCGNWEGESKCPEKESEMYEKYAAEHPNSPTAPEALYNSAWRQAALIEIYKNENKPKQVDEARNRAKAVAQTAITKYPQSDWAYRARTLVYLVEQGIPTWGNVVE